MACRAYFAVVAGLALAVSAGCGGEDDSGEQTSYSADLFVSCLEQRDDVLTETASGGIGLDDALDAIEEQAVLDGGSNALVEVGSAEVLFLSDAPAAGEAVEVGEAEDSVSGAEARGNVAILLTDEDDTTSAAVDACLEEAVASS